MHLRKRTTIVLIAFAIVMFALGTFASLLTVADTTQQKDGYSDSSSLQPLTATSKTVNVTERYSTLTMELNATDRIIVTISLNGEIEYSKNDSQLVYTFLLRNPGSWNVTFRNDNTKLVTYDYTLVLTTFYPITVYPADELLFPTFIAAEFSLFLLLPVNFYDNLKRTRKKTREALLFCTIVFLALGFMPLLTLLTGTSTPLFSPVSTSMEPTILPGDLAIVTHVYPRSLQVGDIIVYDKLMDSLQSTPSQISTPTLHRIFRIVVLNNQRLFVTKGDNNPDEDSWLVPESGIMGKVVFIVPYVGNILLLLSQLEVKIGILVVGAIIIVLWPNKKTKVKPEMKNNEDEKATNN